MISLLTLFLLVADRLLQLIVIQLQSCQLLNFLLQTDLEMLQVTLEWANSGQILSLGLDLVELGVFLLQFLLKVTDVLIHANDLVLDAIGRLFDDLVDVDLRPDAFGLGSEVKSLQRLLHIGRQLRYAADHSSL